MRLLNVCIGGAAACVFLCLLSFRTPAETPEPLSVPPHDEVIDRAIHDYILAHPEVLIQSLRIAKEREQERQAAAAKSLIASLRKELVEDPNTPVLGNPAGDVTLVEFFDYRCPYCRQVETFLQSLIQSDPGLRIAQKEFPILGPESAYAARVALAAHKQGKHKQFHDALMARRSNFDQATILKVVEEAGVDMDRIKVDINNPDVDSELRRTREIATALRLSGTPAFVIGTELVPGATDLATLKAMVEDARRSVN
jgi:protein-disulfide isomerase